MGTHRKLIWLMHNNTRVELAPRGHFLQLEIIGRARAFFLRECPGKKARGRREREREREMEAGRSRGLLM